MSALTFSKVRIGQKVTAPGCVRGARRRRGIVIGKDIVRGADFVLESRRRHGLRLVNLQTEDGDDGQWFEAHELRRAVK